MTPALALAPAPPVTGEDVAAAALMLVDDQQRELTRLREEIAVLRARLGVEPDDGGMSFARIRALEDAADAARTHLLGGPVSREDALAACERARRAA